MFDSFKLTCINNIKYIIVIVFFLDKYNVLCLSLFKEKIDFNLFIQDTHSNLTMRENLMIHNDYLFLSINLKINSCGVYSQACCLQIPSIN